jgi:hypothetical protein
MEERTTSLASSDSATAQMKMEHNCYRSMWIWFLNYSKLTKLNSVVWVHERTIPTERPPLVGEVSANFCRQRVPHCQRDGPLRPYSRLSRLEPLLFLPSSSSVKIIHFIQKYLIVFLVRPSTQQLSKQNNNIVLAFHSFGVCQFWREQGSVTYSAIADW